MTIEICPLCDISGCQHIRARATPKPVTWPEGAFTPRYDTRILVRMLDDGRSRSERELILRALETLHRADEADRAEMAHLSAGGPCVAAADYVEGRG